MEDQKSVEEGPTDKLWGIVKDLGKLDKARDKSYNQPVVRDKFEEQKQAILDKIHSNMLQIQVLNQ